MAREPDPFKDARRLSGRAGAERAARDLYHDPDMENTGVHAENHSRAVRMKLDRITSMLSTLIIMIAASFTAIVLVAIYMFTK